MGRSQQPPRAQLGGRWGPRPDVLLGTRMVPARGLLGAIPWSGNPSPTWHPGAGGGNPNFFPSASNLGGAKQEVILREAPPSPAQTDSQGLDSAQQSSEAEELNYRFRFLPSTVSVIIFSLS